jgi:hypothetical protein
MLFFELIEHAAQRGRSTGSSLFLYDLRQMSLDEDIFRLFDSPQLIALAGMTRQDRTAVLCSPRDKQFLLMEDAAVVNGFKLRVFAQRTLALSWLRSAASASRPEQRPSALG